MIRITEPSTIVVDASVCVWACLPVAMHALAINLIRTWRLEGLRLIAPATWLGEALSAIRMGRFYNTIPEQEALKAIYRLDTLRIHPIIPDRNLCISAFGWAEKLQQARAYDALYVALAEREGAELWTGDQRLANAARQAGASWIRWAGESTT
jgi:predicted nucleic acid-binding protein